MRNVVISFICHNTAEIHSSTHRLTQQETFLINLIWGWDVDKIFLCNISYHSEEWNHVAVEKIHTQQTFTFSENVKSSWTQSISW